MTKKQTNKRQGKQASMTDSSRRSAARRKPYAATVSKGMSGDTLVISHRELVFSGGGSSYGDPTKIFTFQPGNLSWLRSLSNRFEYYEVIDAVVEVIAGNSANTNGQYVMNIDYDVSDAMPSDQLAMMNGGNSVSASIWKDSSIRIKPANIMPRKKLCSLGINPTGTDQKMYDAFNVNFRCGVTCHAQVFVKYSVRLTVPQIAETNSGTVVGSGSPSAIDATHTGFESLAIAADGKVPARIAKPSPAAVLAGLPSAFDAFQLPPNTCSLLEASWELATGDSSAVTDNFADGVTVSFPHNGSQRNTADTLVTTLYELVTGSSVGTFIPAIVTTATVLANTNIMARSRSGATI